MELKDKVIAEIKNRLTISSDLQKSNSPVIIDYTAHKRNKVFMIDDPKAVQSQIYILSKDDKW